MKESSCALMKTKKEIYTSVTKVTLNTGSLVIAAEVLSYSLPGAEIEIPQSSFSVFSSLYWTSSAGSRDLLYSPHHHGAEGLSWQKKENLPNM